jgi:integrase/recombinase XerD
MSERGGGVRAQVDRYLGFLGQECRLSANTVAAYRNDLAQLADYLDSLPARRANGERPGATVTRAQVTGFVLSLRERGYAPATVARKVAATRALFHFLSEQGEIPENPAHDLGSPTVRKPMPRAISADDIARLLARAGSGSGPDGLRDRAMLHLLYATGMRVTELVSLDVGDLDLEASQVRCVGRRGRERSLPLEPEARQALVDYLERGRAVLLRQNWGEHALFLNQRGDRLTRQGFWLIMKALARDSGIASPVTPHTLRHSFAAHRLRDGIALERLRELLGHANISTTQMYRQLGPATGQPAPPGRGEELAPLSS